MINSLLVSSTFIGTAVMVSLLREMGPFMTGLILAASPGSRDREMVQEKASELAGVLGVKYIESPGLTKASVKKSGGSAVTTCAATPCPSSG